MPERHGRSQGLPIGSGITAAAGKMGRQERVHTKAHRHGDAVAERGWANHCGPPWGLVAWRLECRPAEVLGITTEA